MTDEQFKTLLNKISVVHVAVKEQIRDAYHQGFNEGYDYGFYVVKSNLLGGEKYGEGGG